MADEELLRQLLKQVEELTEEVKTLKEQLGNPIPLPYGVEYPAYKVNLPEACKHCSNHPSNGGSGICHCILGSYTVT